MTKNGRRTTLMAALLSGSALAVVAAPAFAAAPSQTTNVSEVVVTASKREQAVKNTPTSLTVLDNQAMKNLGIDQFHDYLQYVPNLAVNETGVPGASTVIIRGLDTGWEQTSTTVGFYIDEVPFTASSSGSIGALVNPDPDLSDVSRVEVLKGPQATLYGARTMGGVIRVVSIQPDLTHFSGSVRLSGSSATDGGYGYGLRGTVNIPLLEDKIALRVTAFRRHDPGVADNVQTGENDVSSATASGAKATLRLHPNERLDITLTGYMQNLAGGADATDLNMNTLQPIYGYNKFSSAYPTSNSSQMRMANATINYEVGPGTLTSSTSYSRYRNHYAADYTNAYGILLALFGGLAGPNYAVRGDLFPSMDKFSQEFRYTSHRVGNFEGQAGLFYTQESVHYNTVLQGYFVPTNSVLAPPFGNLIHGISNGIYKEVAPFANLTYYFTDDLDLTGGLRYSSIKQDFLGSGNGLLAGAGTPHAVSKSESNVDYLANLRWRATPHISTYLRFATGFRPGGSQFSAALGHGLDYRPDKVYNYEAGLKGTWLENRLTANFAAFHMDWKDLQLNELIGGLTNLGNGGDARVNGLEFDGQFRPVDGLVLGGSFGYNDAKMSALDPHSTAGAAVGDPLPFSPKTSGSLTADYSMPLASDLTGGLGASILYQGSRHSGFPGDTLNTDRIMPSYTTVNLRARLDWERCSVIFRVNNVGDEHGLAGFAIGRIFAFQNIPGTGVFIQPRTYSVSVEARF